MAHSWRFFRAGGFDQVRLERGEDIAKLAELDPKLWVALSCPTTGLELDARTLALLDADGDARIRVPEVIAAAQWTCQALRNPDDVLKGSPDLPLSAINTETDEGKRLLSSAKQLLVNLGKGGALTLTPADVSDTVQIFAKTLFNGDGVIPVEAAGPDLTSAQALRDAMACVGSVKDLSGLDGINQAKVDQFFAEASAYRQWWSTGEGDPEIFPLHAATPAAFEALRRVEAKVNDFFARCALAAMEERATSVLGWDEKEYAALSNVELSAQTAAVRELPIARIAPGKSLPLGDRVNPAWAEDVANFNRACVSPLLGGREELTALEWTALQLRLAGHRRWFETKPAGSVEPLGIARLTELLDGSAKTSIESLLAQDRALEPELQALGRVDKLVHFHRDLASFLENFVSFRAFYRRRLMATFQAGVLYLDGRACELCMRVDDPARHGTLASFAMIYLAYCDLSRKGAPKMQIVAAFTGGDSSFLMVGRNGVFYDRSGQDWDATITKIVEQPISVRQAFWSPYRRVGRFISAQIENFATAHDKSGQQNLAAATTTPPPASGFDIAKFAGVFAAIGLALGAIGSAAALIFTGFLGLKVWQMPLVVAGAMFLVSAPSMLLAALKWRQRNLGPLLDASGWAINARARISIPFGATLTRLAVLPPGSERALLDPYTARKSRWIPYVVLLLVLAAAVFLWRGGFLAAWMARLRND